MIGASFTFLVLFGQLPGAASDPTALVSKLGSGRYAEREAAEAALERLGRHALGALRSAKDTRDPEVRSRTAILIEKIEGSLLTQPTLIALDFTDCALPDVLKSFGDQAGIKMSLFPEQLATWPAKRITLREPSPLPFWKALDRLCEVAQLQYNFGGTHGFPNHREPVFPLFAGTTRPAGPMSDSGPFRVNVIGLHYQRDVSFVPPGSQVLTTNRGLAPARAPILNGLRQGHSLNEQFSAQVQIAAEPRLSVSQNGPLRVIEAVDDQGQSLTVSPAGGSLTQRYSAYFGMTAGSTLHLQVPLRHPERPSKTIARLRGTLPVLVATRKPDPLVIPLAGAGGKSFRNDEVVVNIDDVRINANTHQTSIELSIQPISKAGAAPTVAVPQGNELTPHRPETYQQQIEIVDSQGRSIPWYHSNDAEGARMTLTLNPHNQGAPAELRYYVMARAATEVSFAFDDLPMP